MYFKKIYKPIPLVYNLVLAMLWRHPENVELDKVNVVHYCAAVSYFTSKLFCFCSDQWLFLSFNVLVFCCLSNYRVRSHGDTQGSRRIWREKTSKC